MSDRISAVIDTNVLRTTINRKNFEFFIYQAFISEQFNWVVSTEILEEYEEKLIEFYSPNTATYVLNILCTAPNVVFAEPSFRWNLIIEDPDDNKFSNLALSTNVHCLVTYDKHFHLFKNLDFPPLQVLNPKEFYDLLDFKLML